MCFPHTDKNRRWKRAIHQFWLHVAQWSTRFDYFISISTYHLFLLLFHSSSCIVFSVWRMREKGTWMRNKFDLDVYSSARADVIVVDVAAFVIFQWRLFLCRRFFFVVNSAYQRKRWEGLRQCSVNSIDLMQLMNFNHCCFARCPLATVSLLLNSTPLLYFIWLVSSRATKENDRRWVGENGEMCKHRRLEPYRS